MNTRMNSIGLKLATAAAVVVFVVGSALAQSPSGKLTDNRFDRQIWFRFDLFPFLAKRQGLSFRHAGFGLMPAANATNNARAMTPLAAAPNLQVFGGGMLGRLTKWTGLTSSNSVIGDSTIFEDKFGTVGIGTDSPTSKLTVAGMIQSLSAGFKFPDGTVQTTAGLSSVFHNSTLTGNGTAASPLGVAVPLELTGSVLPVDFTSGLVRVRNTAPFGNGMTVFGGASGGGVLAIGGKGDEDGGYGVQAFGGTTTSLSFSGGAGVIAGGGGNLSNGFAGPGVFARGGFSDSGHSGPGVRAFGGSSREREPGAGVAASGGDYEGTSDSVIAGKGVEAFGGNSFNKGNAGPGVVATGGNAAASLSAGGHGVVGVGGIGISAAGTGGVFTGGHPRGSGVSAHGADERAGDVDGGDGVSAFGGASRGVGRRSGHGIVALSGPAENGADQGLAGFFLGNVRIQGDLNVVNGTKNFKIDHPLDPENKYLSHAAIESSEVLNVYSGNVTTDARGEATVTLPDWFEALNRDFRYQLTVIGTFAQAIVAEKVKQNRFRVKTSAPNTEVSWQVTGVRSDAAMLKHPFKVEEDKPERERGAYLSPEAFGQPQERGAEWAHNPEMMQQMKEAREKALKAKQN